MVCGDKMGEGRKDLEKLPGLECLPAKAEDQLYLPELPPALAKNAQQ